MISLTKIRFYFAAISVFAALSCLPRCTGNTFTQSEIELIGSDSTAGKMALYTVNNKKQVAVLRSISIPFSVEDLQSAYYSVLKKRMLATVLDSSNTGVGIAAPQVGISRRLIAVQRFDKPGEPFEFYANIQITELSSEKKVGWEGCLSIPNKRDTVLRSERVIISYTDDITLTQKQDTISGLTAVIFQHETDHLEGILYIDRVASKNSKKYGINGFAVSP